MCIKCFPFLLLLCMTTQLLLPRDPHAPTNNTHIALRGFHKSNIATLCVYCIIRADIDPTQSYSPVSVAVNQMYISVHRSPRIPSCWSHVDLINTTLLVRAQTSPWGGGWQWEGWGNTWDGLAFI